MLAIVHQQQATHPSGHLTQDVAQRPTRLWYDAQRPRQRVGDQLRPDRSQIREPRTVREPISVDRGDVQGEPGLAHPAWADERDHAMAVDQCGELARLGLSADEAGKRHWQSGVGAGGPAQLHPHVDQCRPVGNAELAQQGRYVALHGPHRDMEPVGDLAVAEPVGDRRQHLGLPLGDAGANQPLSPTAAVATHTDIIRRCQHPLYGDRLRTKIRRSHGCVVGRNQ